MALTPPVARWSALSFSPRSAPLEVRAAPGPKGPQVSDPQAIGYAISADMSPQLAECIGALPKDHWKPDREEVDAIREWADEPVHNPVDVVEHALSKGASAILMPVSCRRQLVV
jgi:hypothetical protein